MDRLGIKDRVVEAMLLLEAKRYEGALISALIAVAGTSRKRYPRGSGGIGDKQAFCRLLDDESYGYPGKHAFDTEFNYEGKQLSLGEILYEYYRCQLMHEAGLRKVDVLIGPPHPNPEARVIETLAFVQEGIQLSFSLVRRFLSLVVNVRENQSLFSSEDRQRFTQSHPWTAVAQVNFQGRSPTVMARIIKSHIALPHTMVIQFGMPAGTDAGGLMEIDAVASGMKRIDDRDGR